jgi:hypothetical protein
MPSTSKGLPYPSGSDVPDIVSDFQALAEAVDSELDDYSTTGHGHGSDYISPNVLNAKGDLITATGDNALSILTRGATDGHVLTVDSNESTGLKWAAAPGASGGGIEPTIIDAKGDLIVGQAADTPVRLAAGSTGQLLSVNPSATNGLEWKTVNIDEYSAGTGLSLTGTTFSINTSVVTLTGSQTLTTKTISGANNTLQDIPGSAINNTSIANGKLENSSITINGSSVSLGSSTTIPSYSNGISSSNSNKIFYNDTGTLPSGTATGDIYIQFS